MNILIFSASTGGGHKRAAAAIEAKIRQSHPETTVTVVDALKSIGKMYNKTVCGGYHFMATKVPKVYVECYKITDRKNIIHKAVMKSNTMMSKKLLETIESCNPDIIIICHPFVTTMVSRLKAKGKLDVKAIALITDYNAHRTYIAPNIDAYVLAEPYMARKLEIEYEYIFTNGELDIDKIIAQSKRKRLCSLSLNNISQIGIWDDDMELEQDSTMVLASDNSGEMKEFFINFKYRDYGETTLFFSPNDKLVNMMIPYLPREIRKEFTKIYTPGQTSEE